MKPTIPFLLAFTPIHLFMCQQTHPELLPCVAGTAGSCRQLGVRLGSSAFTLIGEMRLRHGKQKAVLCIVEPRPKSGTSSVVKSMHPELTALAPRICPARQV